MQHEYPTKEIPYTETISSMAEPESGSDTLFTGSTEALFAELAEKLPC